MVSCETEMKMEPDPGKVKREAEHENGAEAKPVAQRQAINSAVPETRA